MASQNSILTSKILRFPRLKTNLEKCLTGALDAFRHGDRDKASRLVRNYQQTVASVRPTPARQDRYSWHTLPQFDPSAVAETKYLVEGFLSDANVHLLYGERGCFKSTFSLLLASAISSHKKFLGLKTRRRRVFYLDYENPADVIKGRIDDLGLNVPDDWFKIWDRFRCGAPPKPGDPLLEEIVKECVADTGNGLVIFIDSWSSILSRSEGGELTGQIAPIYLQLRRLADLGATIIVLDHTKKNEPGILYGGEDKEAKADSSHNLQLYNKNRANPVVLVKSWRKRHAPKGEGSFAFEVQGEQDRKGRWHIRRIVKAESLEIEQGKDNIELLKRIIREDSGFGQEKIAKLASKQGLGRDQATELLKSGIGKHWECDKLGHNKFRYRVK